MISLYVTKRNSPAISQLPREVSKLMSTVAVSKWVASLEQFVAAKILCDGRVSKVLLKTRNPVSARLTMTDELDVR